MQEKIEKLFSFFGNIKNEPFYTSCISQIVEIYQSNPESLKLILYNLNHIIFSSSRESRLRLKHRQICASIIAKLNKIFIKAARSSLEKEGAIEIENFQLDTDQTKSESKFSGVPWHELDLIEIMMNEKLLMATEKGRSEMQGIDHVEQQKRIFHEYRNMQHATMLNIQNLFEHVDFANQATEQAIKQIKSKFQTKIQKNKAKSKEQLGEVELVISSPFNLMFEICMENMLNPEWELRHLSVLILRELLAYPELLGFSFTISMKKYGLEKRYQILAEATKDHLRKHLSQSQSKKRIFENIISQTLVLLSLDRFADYQTDESIIIVRMVAAEILSGIYLTLEKEDQCKLLKMVKKVFDREIGQGNRFTWQSKHSFLYLVTLVSQEPSQHPTIFKFLEESMVKMLGKDQIDQIILCICKCFTKFMGQAFFKEAAIQRVNLQIWMVIEQLDDISISTIEAMRLLQKMFPYYNLDVVKSLNSLKKFFSSKILQVRTQLYILLTCLYSKKIDFDKRQSIVDKNITQFLQACIVEGNIATFDRLKQLAVHLFYYVHKDRKSRRILDFITNCIIAFRRTNQIISQRFEFEEINKMIPDKNNDYLFIYEAEQIGVPLSYYIDKRIWKFSIVLAEAIKFYPSLLKDFMKGIEVHDNDRSQLLRYLLLSELSNSPVKGIEDYKKEAFRILELESYDFWDQQIQIYSKELESMLQKNITVPGPEGQLFKQILELYQAKSLRGKSLLEVYKLIEQLHNEGKNQFSAQIEEKLRYLLSIMEQIDADQKDLSCNVKVLAVNYLTKVCKYQQFTKIILLIGPLHLKLPRDQYSFMSEKAAEACASLSQMMLAKKKKVNYQKFNKNSLTKVAERDFKRLYNLMQVPGTYCLEGSYMHGICAFIRAQDQHWLSQFTSCFIEDYDVKTKINPKLKLLRGTISEILKIDKDGCFTQQLLAKLEGVLEAALNQEPNKKLLTKILSQMMLFLCQNYSAVSNIFLEWYLKQMEKQKLLVFQVLEGLCLEHLFQISGLSSLFIMRIIKSIANPLLHQYAINCLSNLIVGVYTNIRVLPFSPNLKQLSLEGIDFVKNFRDSSKFQYKLYVNLKERFSLRQYQLEGVSWFGFLVKYNLNGALCDDMGLGKTLQTLIHIQNEYIMKKKTKSKERTLNSLIVVPTTLVDHWRHEYMQYFESPSCQVVTIHSKRGIEDKLETMKRKGPPKLAIINYGTLEKVIGQFEGQLFEYVILDEGHVIKNPKTIKFQTVKKLQSNHRFILTGTPIQNRLKELWALFDFLMPGYLYSEKKFNEIYDKLFQVNLTTFQEDDLLFSQGQKKVLEKLHFKVMPFILRRVKADVLQDLPEKIINDYPCGLTDTQQELYNRFECDHTQQKTSDEQKFVLASLMQMRKIVNHPSMVGVNCDYTHSGKFLALEELFNELELNDEDSLMFNKVIIFSRFNSTIDLIQKIFLIKVYPKLKYLKLCKTTPVADRFKVAQTFNGDIGIKLLLVTTAIGGEGLNLSSANTVIMFDHDYNPTVDMQAIDRAHRIGQKRVLNVYRLITMGTLQERIMGIQKFKKNLSNAIVNIDNKSIKNIKDSKLPDLLQNVRELEKSKEKSEKIGKSMYQQMLKELKTNSIDAHEFNKKF